MEKEEVDGCVFTFDIKTIRTYSKQPKLNNPNNILEVFATITRINEAGKMSRLTLRSMDNVHAMETIFFGNIQLFQPGDQVRAMGQLVGQSGQLKILKMSKIDLSRESSLINRLTAISTYEFAKVPVKIET